MGCYKLHNMLIGIWARSHITTWTGVTKYTIDNGGELSFESTSSLLYLSAPLRQELSFVSSDRSSYRDSGLILQPGQVLPSIQ